MSKSLNNSPRSASPAMSLPIPVMYDLVRGGGGSWGIDGYQVPKLDHDAAQMKAGKIFYEYNVGKKKRPRAPKIDPKKVPKKPGIFTEVEKRANTVPPPWQYEVPGELTTKEGKNGTEANVPPQASQKMTFRWKNIPQEKHEYVKPKKPQLKPLDMKASKNTFIDQIVTVNKKKDYPIPGPGSAFFDKKSARLVEEDKRELLIMKESTKATKKHNTSQAARTMSFINEKYQKTMPGPGTYPKLEENGKAAPPKKPKEHMKYADFKKSLEEMKKKEKDKMRAEEERIKEMKAKIGMPEKELPPLPLPVDLPLFDRVIKQYGDLKVRMKARAMAKPKENTENGVRGGPGFGTDMRFERDSLKKWKTEVENFNKGIGEGKQLDPKKDKMPGPAQYSLINYYEGKKVKKPFKTKYSNEPHVNYKRLSDHAPQLSVYHSQEF